MPGNEVGDRIHNFLGGESLSQGQHHSQVFDGNWSGLNNSLWVGSQRQVGVPPISNLKNFSAHQFADADRGHIGQPSSMNFTQSGLKPESASSQLQNESTINGYMQGHRAFQTRQNETDFLGVHTASQGLDLRNKNSTRLEESTESPVDYDFFGRQQQINGQHLGISQPLPRQQAGRTGLQLLQQQAMLRKMQELQRQQLQMPQIQLREGRQLNSVNQGSSVVKQGSDSLSPAPINGVPVNSISNNSWQSEHMTVNANWLQDAASPTMQGSTSGFLFSPEQGQMHLMGLVPQQVDQSLYGISTSAAFVDQYQYSSVQMDKPSTQQVQASSTSFPGNPYGMFLDQVSMQDGSLVSGQGDQGRNVLGAPAGQGLNGGFLSESLQHMNMQPKYAVMQDSSGRQGLPGPSETSSGKSSIQVAPPQAVATLDPTEEKILFGSDDSVWDIFGSSANTGSVSDGMDSFGAFPSLQSGSWSALMQSAVAESSSNDVGIQEEWSGLGMQNRAPPSGNMPTSFVNYGNKQQSVLADSSLQNASPLNSKPLLVSESAELLGIVAHSPSMQVSAESMSGHQQGLGRHSPRGQPCNKANSWNSIDSASHSVGTISKSQDVRKSLQVSQNSDRTGAMYVERGHASDLDLTNIDSRNVNSVFGNPQVNREGFDLDNFAAVTDSRTTRDTKESSQQLPNNHNLNLWKSVDSKVNLGPSRYPARYQHHREKSPQNFDSSGKNCLEKGTPELNMSGNPCVNETSTNSLFSRQNTSTGGMVDNVWLDANNLQLKQKSSAYNSHKPSSACKFQYHPMGDLDVEVKPSDGTKSAEHSRVTSQHVSQGLKGYDHGYSRLAQFSSQPVGEATEVEKGRLDGLKVEKIPESCSNPGSTLEKSFGGFMPNNTPLTSQNVLELFQKVDQPREHGSATHLTSSDHYESSEMPDAETSDGSVGQFQHYRPTTSQGLRGPSQQFQGFSSVQSSTHGASHGDVKINVSSFSGQTRNESLENTIQGNVSAGFTANHPSLKCQAQMQHVVGGQVTPKESVNARFGSLASLSKQTDDSSVRAQPTEGKKSARNMPKTTPDNNFTSSQASWPSSSKQNQARDPGQRFPVLEASEPSTTYDSSQQDAFTKILGVSAPKHVSGLQNSLASQNLFRPNLQSNIKPEATHPGTKKLDDQIAQAGGSGRSEFPADSAKPECFVGEKQPEKAPQVLLTNDASQNPVTMQSDIEAFGRSLTPNNSVNRNNLLLHQVQALENIDTGPSIRSVKRFKGPESGLDAQQVGSLGQGEPCFVSGAIMKDATDNCPLDPSGNSKVPSFSLNTGDNHERQLSSNDMLASSQNDSKRFPNATNSAANLKGEHSQISPQMAPSWFDRYGMFKNGQMMPIYDPRKIAIMKATEKAFIVDRLSDSLHPLHSSEQANAADASLQVNLQLSSNSRDPQYLCPDVGNQNLVNVRANKRKSAVFELLPWHREVTRSSQKPQNISVAEAEWACAANRLIEKVVDEPEMIEEWSSVLRSKRRLILTTQLMQQLLRAPPRVVLSADASKNYETVAYFVARSVLGHACSASYLPASDTADPPDSESILSEKFKEEKNESILKAAEEIINRAKKLENYLQSAEKRGSILDLRLECEDLEKVSVINRFAKFHSRGQADGSETSLSSDAISSSHKFFLQRYVTAVKLPRNLPDRVQCLSL